MTPEDELRHLDAGPLAGEMPGGAGLVPVRIASTTDVCGVLARTKGMAWSPTSTT